MPKTNCRHRQSERKHTGIYRIHLLITIYRSRCVCLARSETLARPNLLTYSYLLFYFILTWRSNYLILFLTLFIDFRILFIFWVTTFVVMMRVVFIQVMVLMDRFDSFRFVQCLIKIGSFCELACSVVKRGMFLSEIAIISYTICFIFYSLKKLAT